MKCTTTLCLTLLVFAFGAAGAWAQGAGPTDPQIAAGFKIAIDSRTRAKSA